jgi:hypothetical protein
MPAQQFLSKQCEGKMWGVAVNQNEVLLSRLPDPRGLKGSATCKETGWRLRAQWEAEDRAHWEQLSNRACSAKLGWVEYNPGECKAGGPPPICPVNHWYRDPTGAMASWQRDNQTKRHEREEQLSHAVCGCWFSEAKDKAAHSAEMSSNYAPGDEPAMVVPCGGSCPIPGHDCVGGVCRPQGIYGTLLAEGKKQAGEIALDKAKEVTEEAVIKSIGLVSESLEATLDAAKESPWGAVTLLAEGPSGGKYAEIYEDQVRKFHASLNEFQNEVSLYYRRRKFGPPEEPLIRAQLLKEREDLRERIAEMNEAREGVSREQDLGKYACYEVFEFQNSVLNAAFGRMLGVTALPSVTPATAH